MAVLLWAPVGGAQEVPTSIAVESFRPMPVQRDHLLGVSTSEVLPHLTPSAGLILHGADDPLEVVERRGADRQTIPLIDEQYSAEVAFGIGLFDRAEIGVALPVVYQVGQALVDTSGGSRALPGPAFGALRVVPRWQLRRADGVGGVGLALVAPVYLPVGDTDSYNSAGVVRAEPRLAVDWRPLRELRLAANVGYEVRPRRVATSRLSDDVVTWGVGAGFPTGLDNLKGVATVTGEVPALVGSDPRSAVSGVEALGALRWTIDERFSLQVGAGSGLTSAIGSPDVRVLAGFEFAPVPRDADGDRLDDRADRCPDQQEDLDGWRDADGCPDPDNDGDGIADAADACPDEAEDVDGWEDDDGCPELDNDGDGVADAEDVCPDEEGIAEKEGCPFVDSDGDGIDDSEDADPNGAEDIDGFQDDDGAPDPDNDGDGIPDGEDECPLEAEVINGVDDADGCPDEGEEAVRVADGSIEIEERIYFDSDRATIKQRSFGVLEQVAAVMKARPEIGKVRIEGHTDGKGRALYNLALSQRRANAVRVFLIDRGVAAERLTARGYGENDPISPNDTEEGRRDNRRVEMVIVGRGGGSG